MHLLALRLFTAAPRHSGKPARNPTRNLSGRQAPRPKRNRFFLDDVAEEGEEEDSARRMAISKLGWLVNISFPAVQQNQEQQQDGSNAA